MCHAYMHDSRIHTWKRARHSTCVYIPVDDDGLQIAKLLSERGKREKKNNEKKRKKKGERWIERNRKKGKQEKGRGTCCADRTSCEHVRNTFDEFIRNEIQDVSRHVLLDG